MVRAIAGVASGRGCWAEGRVLAWAANALAWSCVTARGTWVAISSVNWSITLGGWVAARIVSAAWITREPVADTMSASEVPGGAAFCACSAHPTTYVNVYCPESNP